jgi:hypothetical protein
MNDLIISVADGYQEKVLEALLNRVPISSGIRQFEFTIIKNPGKDPGSYNDSHELLRPFINQFKYAIVLFDLEGSGVDMKSREEVEATVESLLSSNGWENRNTVVVISPELENWIWIDNPNVESAIGWNKQESLYDWARKSGYIAHDSYKPERPKETMQKALYISETPMSASIYKKIAQNVSYKRCTDPAFNKLLTILTDWFSIV